MSIRARRDRAPRRRKGAFIGFVGPDGSGKTTVAAEIDAQCTSWDRAFAYVHWRPSLTTPFASPSPHATPLAKVAPPGRVSALDQVVSLARLFRSVLTFNIAYLLRLRPKIRSGAVVVVDRWIYNYVTQPNSVRYYGPPRVATFVCSRLVAQPHPVFVLEAPASVLLARSDELSEDEIRSEYDRVRHGLVVSNLRWLDATSAPADLAAQVLSQCGITGPRSD